MKPAHRIYRTHLAGAVAGCALAVAIPFVALAGPGYAAAPAAPAHVVIAFGREGGNIRPLTVTIDDHGVVAGSGTNASPHLSRDAVDGLLKLARAEGFFAMPARMIGHGLPDIGGRFITVTTSAGTKTVHVRFVRNAAFDQLYAVLSAVAGLQS